MSRASGLLCLRVTALALSVVIASEALAEIIIRQPETIGHFDVQKHNEAQFKSGFPFRVKPKVSQLGDVELRRHIDSLNLSTLGGIRIEALDIDKGNNIVVGTTIPNASIAINIVEKSKKGRDIVVSVRNSSGSFSKVEKNQVGVFDLEGKPLNFELLRISESTIEVYFEVLLDRSGSMSSYIKDVVAAASEFMDLLPKNAKCRVTSFNHNFTSHSKGYAPCKADVHGLKGMEAGGGTLIYEPLLNSYEQLGKAGNKLKAVIVITDGMGQSKITKADVLKKKTAPTYLYWLGSYKEEQLEGIADTYIYGKQDLKKVLSAFFSTIGSAVNSQHVISTTNP